MSTRQSSRRNNSLPTLEQVDQFALPPLVKDRLIKDCDYTDDQADDLLREAKRMLYLHAVSREHISPSLKVDDAWHTMLLFTRSYYKFAKFIGVYVHHEPTDGPPDGGRTYAQTKANYEKFFGTKPDPRYWG